MMRIWDDDNKNQDEDGYEDEYEDDEGENELSARLMLLIIA